MDLTKDTNKNDIMFCSRCLQRFDEFIRDVADGDDHDDDRYKHQGFTVVADGCCGRVTVLGVSLVMTVYWLYGYEYPKELRKTFTSKYGNTVAELDHKR